MWIALGVLFGVGLLLTPGILSLQPAVVNSTDRYVKDAKALFPCLDDQFQCKISKKCIARDLVMNGRTGSHNCGNNDTSDEEGALPRCHSDEFRCRLNGQCIPRAHVNRLIGQCEDKSDAGGIRGLPCRSSTEFRCPQGNCVPRRAVRSRMNECTRSGFDEDLSFDWTCNEKEFQCPDTGRCIPREKVRDGIFDCLSRADEDEPYILKDCGESTGEFRCPGSLKRCISRHKAGDGKPDCVENSMDEQIGVLDSCNDDEFTCLAPADSRGYVTLRCIPRSWVNDGVVHCPDDSDENQIELVCRRDEHSCDNGTRCLSDDKICDSIVDCQDCSDELDSGCSSDITSKYFACTTSTGLGETITEAGVLSSHCILRSYFCDGHVDCADQSDELKAGPGMKCRKALPDGTDFLTCVLPDSLRNDGFVDCDDAADEQNLTKMANAEVTCLGTATTIFQRQECDEIFDCPNLTDECLCGKRKQANLAIQDVCDNVCYDSHHVSTEEKNSPCDFCHAGQLLCSQVNVSNSSETKALKCLNLDRICDGVSNCEDGRDEWHCNKEMSGNRIDRANETFATMICPHNYFTERYSNELAATAKVCNNVPECIGLVDECDSDNICNFRPRSYCAMPQKIWCYESIPIIPSQICDGIAQCDDEIDEKFCDDIRFTCDVIATSSAQSNGASLNVERLVSISKKRVCDGFADCKNGEDELECPEHFYCRNKEKPFYVVRSRVQDGVHDCSDGSDECPDEDAFKNNHLSSKSELIASAFIRVWLYIVAIPAVLGNFIVIAAKSLKILENLRRHIAQRRFGRHIASVFESIVPKSISKLARNQSALANCNDVLVFNLALADISTGIYLVTLIVKTKEYSGSYCSNDILWRTSQDCENIGTVALLSAQTSVLIMVSLTSYRLYAVLRPIRTGNLRTTRAVFCCVCCWVLSTVIACIPRLYVLRDAFVSRIWFPQESGSHILHLPYADLSKMELAKLLKRACVLAAGWQQSANLPACKEIEQKSWDSLIKIVTSYSPTLMTRREFGYYSAHGVCLPSILSADVEDGAQNYDSSRFYSLFILSANFVFCLYIATAYAIIGLHTSIRHDKMSRRRSMESDISTSLTNIRRFSVKQGNYSLHNAEKQSKIGSRVRNMNRKIARLVLINCICWIPLCVIGFIAQCGIVLPGWIYSLAAVVLLSINSAADPFIYSETIHTAWEVLHSKFKKLKRKISMACAKSDPGIHLELQRRHPPAPVNPENQQFDRFFQGNSRPEHVVLEHQVHDMKEPTEGDIGTAQKIYGERPTNFVIRSLPGRLRDPSSPSPEPRSTTKFVDRLSKFLLFSGPVSSGRKTSSSDKQDKASLGRRSGDEGGSAVAKTGNTLLTALTPDAKRRLSALSARINNSTTNRDNDFPDTSPHTEELL